MYISKQDLSNGAIVTVSTDTTLETKHKLVLVDTSTGDVTITPAGMSDMLGEMVIIKKTSSSNSLIIDPAGSVTIDGSSSKTLSDDNDFIILTSNGSEFITVGRDAASVVVADISDFTESVDDRVNALLVAGNNIDLTYDDNAGSLTVDAVDVVKKKTLNFTGVSLKALFSDPATDTTEIIVLSEDLFPADSIIQNAFIRVNTADAGDATTTVMKLGQDSEADDFIATDDLRVTGTTGVANTFTGVLVDAVADLKADITVTGDVSLGAGTGTLSTGPQTSNGTGTISSVGTAVTGTGTAFLTEVAVGDTLTAAGGTAVVDSITDDTNLVLTGAFSAGDVTDETFTITDQNGSDSVIGSGTAFLTELAVGYRITADGQEKTIATITDDTHLTVSVAFSPDLSADTFTIERDAVLNDIDDATDFDVVVTYS